MTLSRRSLFASLAAGLVAGTTRAVAAKVPDDTAYIQALIDQAIARGQRCVYIPAGTYLLRRTVTVTAPAGWTDMPLGA